MGSIDSFGFRDLTYPTFTYTPKNVSGRAPIDESAVINKFGDSFVQDNRYPAYTAIMADARYSTDYRPKCTKNIAPASQFAVHQWMVHNADKIIEQSRYRQAEWTGAGFGLLPLTPPAAVTQTCDADKCDITKTGYSLGMGIEREKTNVPELFGTFNVFPSMAEQMKDSRKVALTTQFEGGRNSRRG